MLASERPDRRCSAGSWSSATTSTSSSIEAGYDAGVLRLRVPVAERAKPRKIEVTTGADSAQKTAIST